jgi:hypothetical protein
MVSKRGEKMVFINCLLTAIIVNHFLYIYIYIYMNCLHS